MTKIINGETLRFRPHLLGELERNLGQSDAAVEWIEVAVREIVQIGKNIDHAVEIAKKHGICVNAVSFDYVQSRWAQLQILAVYQFLDEFLTNFRSKFSPGFRSKKKDGETLITHTLASFDINPNQISKFEFQTVDFYRKVRNDIMHQSGQSIESDSSDADRIRNLRSGRYDRLNAPNHSKALTFDDFILFSRVTKEFAYQLCSLVEPDNKIIVDVIAKDSRFLRKMKGVVTNKTRMKMKLNTYIQTKIGFVCEDKKLDDILDDIIREFGLLA